MADTNQLKQAQTAYKTLCQMFEERSLSYEGDDESLTVYSGAKGNDLPVAIRMRVDAERMLIIVHSQLPFYVPENRRLEMAIAVSRANYGLPDGNFDYDFSSGELLFRMTSCYRDCLIGQELFEYMFVVSFSIIDQYNDLFEKVATTDMTVNEIMQTIK